MFVYLPQSSFQDLVEGVVQWKAEGNLELFLTAVWMIWWQQNEAQM